jgi:hypothetical protein
MCLFVCSILSDLDIPQEAATIAYKDNNGCTAMGKAQKSTLRTQHIDIKFFALCDWVKRNLIILECIDTSINTANHLTKILPHILFHRHADFLLGHAPPHYSPVYQQTITTHGDNYNNVNQFFPETFTPPITAKAAWIFTPLLDKMCGDLWLIILWHHLA